MTLREFLTQFRRDQLTQLVCVIADEVPHVGRMLHEWAGETIKEHKANSQKGEDNEIPNAR